MSNFFKNFIAEDQEFGRTLSPEEISGMSVFPNANLQNVKYLGKGSVKPGVITCEHYQCIGSSVHIYNVTDGKYQGTFQAISGQINLMEFIWDQCHSGVYKCVFPQHFGATYNCIGWAMGITKWLDPSEITAYISSGLTRDQAINKFIADKKVLYNNSVSVVDPILENLSATKTLTEPPLNNSVAFYFDEDGNCQHGARYIERFNGINLNRWTSKLGSSITIAHELSDLMGTDSVYGNELYNATCVLGVQVNEEREEL